jgi:hypothetical protein
MSQQIEAPTKFIRMKTTNVADEAEFALVW